jgi:glycosyltransferase involved in cell wall biosynthesis
MIVTDVGGNSEAIEHQKCGLVVKPHNPEELGEAILLLMNNMDMARQYGIAARKRVESYFSIERCIHDYESFFEITAKR